VAARGWSSGRDAAHESRWITAIGSDHGDHVGTGGMTDSGARDDRGYGTAWGTAPGNKVGQPIVDTRMMQMFDFMFDFTLDFMFDFMFDFTLDCTFDRTQGFDFTRLWEAV
jgi:hypothetical protein